MFCCSGSATQSRESRLVSGFNEVYSLNKVVFCISCHSYTTRVAFCLPRSIRSFCVFRVIIIQQESLCACPHFLLSTGTPEKVFAHRFTGTSLVVDRHSTSYAPARRLCMVAQRPRIPSSSRIPRPCVVSAALRRQGTRTSWRPKIPPRGGRR